MKNVLFKVLVVFVTLFGFSWGVYAQDEAFNKDDKVVNIGIGLGTYVSHTGYSMQLPPITGSFEYGILDLLDNRGTIGIGGYLGYTSFKYKGSENLRVSDLILGARGLFHYQFIEKLDTYAGIMLGYDVRSYSHADPNLSGSGFFHGYFIGARYYIADKISIFGELGYGIAPLELGISFKF